MSSLKGSQIFKILFQTGDINNTISLSRHKQVCLSGLHFKRYFSHQGSMMGEVSLET